MRNSKERYKAIKSMTQKMNINTITPDPNQPRRAFNDEQMQALESSMRSRGFRNNCPITIDEHNIILDGERRWRTAKKIGIAEVPVEIYKNLSAFEKLLFQLQSEGAEISTEDKYAAWLRLYDAGKDAGQTYASCAKALGANEDHFRRSVEEYREFKKLEPVVTDSGSVMTFEKNFGAISEVVKEKEPEFKQTLAIKAVKEQWSRSKTVTIRQAIKDNPAKKEQILNQDYSDPYEGSSVWKLRLASATTVDDLKFLEQLNKERERKEKIIKGYGTIMNSLYLVEAVMDECEYATITDQDALVNLHQRVAEFIPFATSWLKGLEELLVQRGILNKGNQFKGAIDGKIVTQTVDTDRPEEKN